MLEALTLCTMNTERYRALVLDALQCQENEGSRKTEEGQPIGRDQRRGPCHGDECPKSLPIASACRSFCKLWWSTLCLPRTTNKSSASQSLRFQIIQQALCIQPLRFLIPFFIFTTQRVRSEMSFRSVWLSLKFR
jgi:hypothetical protein